MSGHSPPVLGTVEAARQLLGDALRAVTGLRVYTTPAPRLDPPAAVLSLPDLHWEAYCATPVRATFEIALVVKANDRAIDALAAWVLEVHEALESVDGVTVDIARVGAWDDSLPAYLLETEVALT